MKPTAAKGKFPYAHRTCAEWEYRPETRPWRSHAPVLWAQNGLDRWEQYGRGPDLPALLR